MFTQRLEELLEETNTTKTELSKKTGIPITTMWGWTQKGTQPTAEKVVKIADFFEVSTDYLLGRSDDLGLININANLSPAEEEILTLFRKLSRPNQQQLIGFAKGLAY